MPDKCEHYFGFQAVVYEGGWLVEERDFSDGCDDTIVFDFCPLCGERLTDAS